MTLVVLAAGYGCFAAGVRAKAAYDASVIRAKQVDALWGYLSESVGTRQGEKGPEPINRADVLAMLVRDAIAKATPPTLPGAPPVK